MTETSQGITNIEELLDILGPKLEMPGDVKFDPTETTHVNSLRVKLQEEILTSNLIKKITSSQYYLKNLGCFVILNQKIKMIDFEYFLGAIDFKNADMSGGFFQRLGLHTHCYSKQKNLCIVFDKARNHASKVDFINMLSGILKQKGEDRKLQGATFKHLFRNPDTSPTLGYNILQNSSASHQGIVNFIKNDQYYARFV